MPFHKLVRTEPRPMSDVVDGFIREVKLASGLNARRVSEAWNTVTGCGRFTSRTFFRDGVLTVTLNSSLVRSRLYPQIGQVKDEINRTLKSDPLFVKDDSKTRYVEKIILR